MFKIRPAMIDDLEYITNIYNEAIQKSVATFDTKQKNLDEQKIWFNDHGPKNPIFVAELNGIIIGWGALSKYSDRCAYSDTAEFSIYIKDEYQGKGYGKKLFNKIIEEGEKVGLHVVLSRITEGNEVSIYLHEIAGFEHIGLMKEVGFKFGKRLDVYLMQKIYKN